jgi:two-component system copper resistance phosphate regulon response regulator CusR
VTRAGVPIKLTTREFSLLQFLLQHPGEVQSRARIVESAWEQAFDACTNLVDVYIRYLRSKVDEPHGKRLIHTVRGVGYVVRAPQH